MACLDENIIAAYLDDSLTPGEADSVVSHVESCEPCRALLSAQVRCLPAESDVNLDSVPVAWRYTTSGEFARGGQARIMLAVDDVIGREVAVKEIWADDDDTSRLRGRFLREARITGQLQHPGVVPVYEIGRKDDGQLYYTMQRVRGKTLFEALTGCQGLSKRLNLLNHFHDLCNTVAYAHSRGVVHRDIKPQNVMVGSFGETVLLDWGLAKVRGAVEVELPVRRVSATVDGDGDQTLHGTLIGTPAYMSPEQALGHVERVDERSDTYALGAVLFEILTGQPPHRGRSVVEILDAARRARPRPVQKLEPNAPAELAAIAQKALSADPEDRYASARLLAEEVAKYMTGERVAVYNYSAWELLRRFASRHRVLLSAAALVVAVALLALVAVSVAYRQEASALSRAEHEKAQALREGAVAAESHRLMLEARAKLRSSLEIEDSTAARGAWARLSRSPLFWEIDLGTTLNDVAFSPDGRRLAVASHSRSAFVLEVETRAMRVVSSDDQITTLDVSPDGKSLATGDRAGGVRIWNLDSTALWRDLAGHSGKVWMLRYDADGTHLASCSEDTSVRIWNTTSGELVRELIPASATPGQVQATSVAFSPDGRHVASMHGYAGVAVLWDWHKGVELQRLRGEQSYGADVEFAPDGRRLVAGHGDGTVRVWDLESGTLTMVRRHPDIVSDVEFSPDGSILASADFSGNLRLWDGTSIELSRSLGGHAGSIGGLAFTPDGRLLASCGEDHTVRVWKLDVPAGSRSSRGHTGEVRDAAFDPTGTQIASVGADGKLRLWDARAGDELRVLDDGRLSATSVDFSPDGGQVAVARFDATVTLWSLISDERALLGGPGHGPVNIARFSPDGELLATGSSDSLVRLWQVRDGQERHTLRGHIDRVLGLDFSPDGRQLATGGRDKTLRIWDVADGELLDVEETEDALTGVRFAPDGLTLAMTGEDGSLWLRDVRSKESRLVAKHNARAYALDVSPSGEQLAVAFADHTALIRSMEGGEAIELVGHRAELASIRFAPDGRSVVTTSADGTVRVWDARTGRPSWRAPLLVSSPPRLLNHRGWTPLDGQSDGASWPPAERWVQALETEARVADLFSGAAVQSSDASTGAVAAATAAGAAGDAHLCIAAEDGTLQIWDAARGGGLLASHPLANVRHVVALPAGCLALADRSAMLMSKAGMLHELSDRATAVAANSAEILVATTTALQIHSLAGTHLRDLPSVRGASAVLKIGERVLFGFDNGTLLLTAPSAKPGFYFASTPPSRVVRLLAGPMETVVAGYAGGDVGVWNLEDGSRLDGLRLHGAAIHLAIDGPRLIAASELGDHDVLDLAVYLGSHCDLLTDVWEQVPVVWTAGRARLAPPPPQHPCTP